VPSDEGIARVVVTREVVLDNVLPTIVRREDAPATRKRPPREKSA
jgi:ATP-dependent Clp protease ATP-binding subunit ClpX